MKKILLCLLVLACCFQIFAQEEILIQDDPLSDAPILEQLNVEKSELAVLEKELNYFYNLLQQKAKIRELYKKGDISAITRSLSKETKPFEMLLAENKRDEINHKLGELRIIYGDVPEVQDELLYYQATMAYLKEDYPKARELLTDLRQNFPRSPRREPAIILLLEIYHRLNYDQELIDLANEYSGQETLLLTWWLANAYFNTGDYAAAQEKFTTLSSVEEYAFRAKSMLALLNYFTVDLPSAIIALQTLAAEYPASTRNYDFLLLNLARLSILNQDNNKGLMYYKQYFEMQKKAVPDEILYEIAMEFKNNDNYKEATGFLKLIIEKPRKSEYYTSAKFLLALTQYGYEDLDRTELAIAVLIAENDELLSTLNKKYKLISDYHNIRRQMARIDTTSYEYINLKAQLHQLDAMLMDTNEMMENFYKGLDSDSLILLIALENEYKAYCSTVSEMEALILLSQNIPNDKVRLMIENEIQAGDSTVVSLEIIRFLGHRAFYSQQEYNLAQYLAVEKMLQKIDLYVWKEIKVIAEDNNHQELAEKVGNYVNLVEDNLIAFDIIAELLFGGKPTEYTTKVVQTEIDAIEKNKSDLQAIKEEVIKNFDVQISKKLNKEKTFLVEEFNYLKTKYDNTLNLVIGDVTQIADKYRINLLSVLFQKTQEMDKKYKELQEKVRNE